MRKLVSRIFQRYGVPIELERTPENITVYGFVQQTATSARKYILPEYTPLGELPKGQYLMLLPFLYTVQVEDQVMYAGKWYIVRRVERVWFREEAIYYWCLCEERGTYDQWGM